MYIKKQYITQWPYLNNEKEAKAFLDFILYFMFKSFI